MVAAPETVPATTNGVHDATASSSTSRAAAKSPNGSPSTAELAHAQTHANGHTSDGQDGGAPPNLPPPEIARQIPCRFFPLGTCKYGEQCAFSHSIPIVAAQQLSMSNAGPLASHPSHQQQSHGGAGRDFSSQPMQHPGMMMYYPQQPYDGDFNGFPPQFSPPQGFYYPPQYAPYYAPPQPFYPPAAQPTSPTSGVYEQAAPNAPVQPTDEQAGQVDSLVSGEPSTKVEAPESTGETGTETADAVNAPTAPATATASTQADDTAGPSTETSGVPSFFSAPPAMMPYYPSNGRQPTRNRNLNGSFSGGANPKRQQFLAPDGSKLPKPSCSFFEANRCRNRDSCGFPHRLPDGTDARKLGRGMIGIDGRTENPEDKGGIPPLWMQQQQQQQQHNKRTNASRQNYQGKEGRPPRARFDEASGGALAQGTSGKPRSSADSRVTLGRLPPGSSAPSLVAAINGLTRRIPPISSNANAQSQHQQQRVPSGDDFPTLAAGTGAATPARQSTRPSSPEPTAAGAHAPTSPPAPVKEPWSPESGRDGAPSTEPSPPRAVEKRASSESGDSDFIIVTTNDAASPDAPATAVETGASGEREKEKEEVKAAAQAPAPPKISFASAAAKAAATPAPVRPGPTAGSKQQKRPQAAPVAASASGASAGAKEGGSKSSSATSPAVSTTSSSRIHGKSAATSTAPSTQAPSPVASAHGGSSVQGAAEDDDGFTVAVRKDRRGDHHRKQQQQQHLQHSQQQLKA